MLGIVDLVILTALMFNLVFVQGEGMPESLTLLRYVSAALIPIYLFMRNYIFVMCVTFRLTVPQILKNALFLSFIGLWRNILALAINAALIFALFFFGSMVELIAVPLVLFSVTGFVSMFVCFPVIKKHLLTSHDQIVQDEAE